MRRAEAQVRRFSFRERAVHWLAALSFAYAGLTGLSLWSHGAFWLASVFGGGEAARWGHPWGGTLFALSLGVMYLAWARHMRVDADDRIWLRNAGRYATHDDSGLPEASRFNAGQKLLFWLQVVATILLFASGLVLWLPASMPRALLETAVLIHPAVAIVSIGAIILHVYMGTAAVPGAFRGMIRGWVHPGWAAAHHPKWFREISRK